MATIQAPDPNGKDVNKFTSWSGPSAQNDANNYIQNVLNFWTDERLHAATPMVMPTPAINNNDNNNNGAANPAHPATK